MRTYFHGDEQDPGDFYSFSADVFFERSKFVFYSPPRGPDPYSEDLKILRRQIRYDDAPDRPKNARNLFVLLGLIETTARVPPGRKPSELRIWDRQRNVTCCHCGGDFATHSAILACKSGETAFQLGDGDLRRRLVIRPIEERRPGVTLVCAACLDAPADHSTGGKCLFSPTTFTVPKSMAQAKAAAKEWRKGKR